jgi:phage-related protein
MVIAIKTNEKIVSLEPINSVQVVKVNLSAVPGKEYIFKNGVQGLKKGVFC